MSSDSPSSLNAQYEPQLEGRVLVTGQEYAEMNGLAIASPVHTEAATISELSLGGATSSIRINASALNNLHSNVENFVGYNTRVQWYTPPTDIRSSSNQYVDGAKTFNINVDNIHTLEDVIALFVAMKWEFTFNPEPEKIPAHFREIMSRGLLTEKK